MLIEDILEAQRPRKLATLSGMGTPIDYYADQAVVLYHGTSKNRAKAMGSHIQPRIGEFIRAVYPRAKMQPLIFAADEHFKSKIWSAARFAVAFELGIERRWVTVKEFIDNAAVIKITTDRVKFSQATRNDRPQRGVDKFDYIARLPVQIDDILTDEALVAFFGRSFLESHLIYETAA